MFDVVLDQTSASTVTVPWSTAPSSATPPADFTNASGTLTFAPGTFAKTVSVTVKGDTLLEGTRPRT